MKGVLTAAPRAGELADLASRQPAFGKTGTQEKNWTAFFVGATPFLSTAVLVRDPDRYTPMASIPEFADAGVDRVQGGTFPARIWGAFMDAIGLERVGLDADWEQPGPPARPPARLYLPGQRMRLRGHRLRAGPTPPSRTDRWATVAPVDDLDRRQPAGCRPPAARRRPPSRRSPHHRRRQPTADHDDHRRTRSRQSTVPEPSRPRHRRRGRSWSPSRPALPSRPMCSTLALRCRRCRSTAVVRGVRASDAVTHPILELQAADTLADQLRHRREHLPEQDAGRRRPRQRTRDWERRRDGLQRQLDELERGIARSESDSHEIDVHRARLEKQLKTVIAPREAEALMHEIAHAQRAARRARRRRAERARGAGRRSTTS